MHFDPGGIYHLYNRGNNGQPIFFTEANYLYFVEGLRKWIKPSAEVLARCLMPNHFHLIILPSAKSIGPVPNSNNTALQELSFWIGKMLSSYTQAINKQQGTTGSLFQSRTKAKEVRAEFSQQIQQNPTQHYLITALKYLHLNPVAAGIVAHPADWIFSSYLDYCGGRAGTLCNKELLFELTLGGVVCS